MPEDKKGPEANPARLAPAPGLLMHYDLTAFREANSYAGENDHKEQRHQEHAEQQRFAETPQPVLPLNSPENLLALLLLA